MEPTNQHGEDQLYANPTSCLLGWLASDKDRKTIETDDHGRFWPMIILHSPRIKHAQDLEKKWERASPIQGAWHWLYHTVSNDWVDYKLEG